MGLARRPVISFNLLLVVNPATLLVLVILAPAPTLLVAHLWLASMSDART